MANFEIEGKLLKKFGMEWKAPSIQFREFVIEIIGVRNKFKGLNSLRS